ncbi:hypothetical protein WA158_002355 [Blastocystis sp. Blastoise]
MKRQIEDETNGKKASALLGSTDISYFLSNDNLTRKSAPEVDSIKDDISFQWFDIDMYDGPKLEKDPTTGTNPDWTQEESNPIVRFFGVTRDGHSVCLHLHGFLPYFYCSLPNSWSDDDLTDFKNDLSSRLTAQMNRCHVVDAEIVYKQSIMGYQGMHDSKFLKVTVNMPNAVPTCRSLLSNGISYGQKSTGCLYIYEAKIPFVLRCMIDLNIVGCNWLTAPAGKYTLRPMDKKKTTCQYEIDIYYKYIISHNTEGIYMDVAPFRILSFDIECLATDGGFPTGDKDPVIQIANVLTEQGSSEPFYKCVFCLNTCAPIPGAEIFAFENEKDLLAAWSQFVIASDPDVITGYNIQNFDLPYIFDRATALKIEDKVHIIGKLIGQKSKKTTSTFTSSAYGTHENIDIAVFGRVIFDLLQFMRREYKLTSYSLNNVSTYFLGDQKDDVKYNQIKELQEGDEITRHRLSHYCLKDSLLPQLLLDKLIVLINHIEMARVTGVPISFLLSRGQQIKVVSMLHRKAQTMNIIIPSYDSPKGVDSEDNYQGATVIEPIKGFYEQPISTLDFSSLYPSIMISHNICYTTIVFPESYMPGPKQRFTFNKEEATDSILYISPEEYEVSPTGDRFITKDKKVGILPIILRELLDARKAAKRDMAKETDPLKKKVQNGRQLALKISANSVYGFTGATVGQLPCLQISKSVTSFGREMIEKTKNTVMTKYTIANGYPGDAQVIYGDTDSVMVRFGVNTVPEAMKLGKEAAEYISTLFPPPVKLEFEKVYFPYLLMNKKRYAGLYWTKEDKWDKMDCKGIETVRRDNCGLVRLIVDMCLKKILIDRDVNGAIEYVKNTISSLLQNNIDISLLVITKSLGKKADSNEYKAKAAHVELAERMYKRDPGSAPKVGDRVQYVIIEKEKNAPAYTKSEDPIYVLENNLPIDVSWYLEHQLKGPLERIFEPVCNVTSSIFSGDHTLVRRTASVQKSGIGLFISTKTRCVGCKQPLETGIICNNCMKDGKKYYTQTILRYECLEEQFTELWTTCQRCQGSLHQKVICGNRDCPIFFQREKIRKELKETQEKVIKFDELF